MVSQIALGGTVRAEDYALQRDLVISRIGLSRDTAQGSPSLFEQDRALIADFEATMTTYGSIEGGQVPTTAVARKLEATLDRMAVLSHEYLNRRRNAEQASNVQTAETIRQLQIVQIGTLALLCLAGGALLWLTRRALSNDLATAYAEVRQRASALEHSQAQLATANREFQEQNAALTQALAELEATTQAQAQLESTMQHLAFPIIPVLEEVLVVPLIGTLDPERLAAVGRRLCEAIVRESTKVAIIDITGVITIDAEMGQSILRIAQATTLLGCHPMLVGINPSVAEELVHLGLSTDALMTQRSLQQAVALALQMPSAQRRPHNGAPAQRR
jgi:anti-anti-sigma regulatory factor